MPVRLAYIQKDGGDWLNETAYTMSQGCQMLGIDVVPFKHPDIGRLPVEKETLVHGWISSVHKALDILGVSPPHVDSLQEDLRPYYRREVWRTTLGWARQHRGYFVKPDKAHKAFTGLVMKGELADLAQTAPFPDEMEVIASEVVTFVSEYRLFIHRGVIVGAKNYRGDFTRIVDFDFAQECVRAYRDAPVAYSLDLGLLEDGTTSVVEVNDAYALGAYGLAPLLYAQLVEDRWAEMVGLQD